MCNCKECNVSIVSGMYCNLCAKHMISTNNNVSKEASMKSFKSKLVINDLSLDSESLGFGNSTLSSMVDENETKEFVYNEEDGDSEELAHAERQLFGTFKVSSVEKVVDRKAILSGATTTTMEYNGKDIKITMLPSAVPTKKVKKGYNPDKSFQPITDLGYALAILENADIPVEGLSEEFILEYAAQIKDLAEEPFRYSKIKEDKVTVKVQRMSSNGHFYNAKDKQGNLLSFTFDVEDLFILDDNRVIEGFKYVTDHVYTKGSKVAQPVSVPALVKIMKNLGYSSVHFQYVKSADGHWDMQPVEQRFIVSSGAFTPDAKFDNQQLEEICAAFNYGYEKGEVVNKRTSWSYDYLLEIGSIAIMPVDNEESTAISDNKRYNNGILTGKSVATAAMMQDDITKSEMALAKATEVKAENEAKKVRIAKNANIARAKVRMASDIGVLTAGLIEDSHIAKDNITVAKALNEELELLKSSLVEIMEAARAYKKLHGYAFEYTYYVKIQKMIKDENTQAVADNVPMEILENIKMLNSGEITVDQPDFTDDIAVEIFETVLKYWKKSSTCKLNPEINEVLKAKVAAIRASKAA